MRYHSPPLDHRYRYTTGTGRLCQVPEDICVSRGFRATFSHLEIHYADLQTPSNLKFPGFTLLAFRPFIFYNASQIAQVGA